MTSLTNQKRSLHLDTERKHHAKILLYNIPKIKVTNSIDIIKIIPCSREYILRNSSMDPTAIIVGHSFVKRYEKWIGSRSHEAPLSPRDVCNRVSDLLFLGQSGLQSHELHNGDFLFHASRHDIVIVDCGSNDLANNKTINEVANNILLFARRCIQNGAKIVFVASILPRKRRINTDPDDFANIAEEYNRHMKSLCVKEEQISFHRMTGFSRSVDGKQQPIHHWSEDGIHPSVKRYEQCKKSGMEKYHQAIKTAVHRAAQRYRHVMIKI